MNDIVIWSTIAVVVILLFGVGLALWMRNLPAALGSLAGVVVVSVLWFNIAALRDLAFDDGRNEILSNQYDWVYYAPFAAAIVLLVISIILNFVRWPRSRTPSEQAD